MTIDKIIPVVFTAFLAVFTWIYAIKGLKERKITVCFQRITVTKLEGKKALYYSLFWLAIAILLTLAEFKLLYLFIFSPNEL